MVNRYLRPSANGGLSECRSPEEKVGYGRCHHILDGKQIVINYNKQDKCHYVNVEDGRGGKEKLEAQEKDIINFLDKLKQNDITEERAKEIIQKIK